MCRWLAYRGSPIPLDELLDKPDNPTLQKVSDETRMVVSEPLPAAAAVAVGAR